MSQPQFIDILQCGGAPFQIVEKCGGAPYIEMNEIYGRGRGEFESHNVPLTGQTGGRIHRHKRHVGSHKHRSRGGTLNPVHSLMTGGTLNPVHGLQTGGGHRKRHVGSHKKRTAKKVGGSYIRF